MDIKEKNQLAEKIADLLVTYNCRALNDFWLDIKEQYVRLLAETEEKKGSYIGLLKDIKTITVETSEDNPVAIAKITEEGIEMADGYRVRLTPINVQCPLED